MLKHLITIISLVVTVAASIVTQTTPAFAASQVGFDLDNMKFRGAIQYGTQLQCVNKAYTPVVDADGNLRMIAWGLVEDGLVELPEIGSDWVAGKPAEVEITQLQGCNFVVTATRSPNNNVVKLISWFSSADGFDRMADTGDHSMAATEIAVTSVGHPEYSNPSAGIVVMASRAIGGELIMSTWKVSPGGAIGLYDLDMTGEDGTMLEIVTLELPESGLDNPSYIARVVTAMKTPQGNLKLISWAVDYFGGLTRLADSGNLAGEVEAIAMTRYKKNRLVTAVKNSHGKLQMISWGFDNANTIQRHIGMDDLTFHNPYGPEVEAIDVTDNFVDVAGMYDVVTAARTKTGQLLLTSWGIDTSGNIVQLGDISVLSGLDGPVNIGWTPESNKLVASVRYVDGSLMVMAWRSFKNYASIELPDSENPQPGKLVSDGEKGSSQKTPVLEIEIPAEKPEWPAKKEDTPVLEPEVPAAEQEGSVIELDTPAPEVEGGQDTGEIDENPEPGAGSPDQKASNPEQALEMVFLPTVSR